MQVVHEHCPTGYCDSLFVDRFTTACGLELDELIGRLRGLNRITGFKRFGVQGWAVFHAVVDMWGYGACESPKL